MKGDGEMGPDRSIIEVPGTFKHQCKVSRVCAIDVSILLRKNFFRVLIITYIIEKFY